ncbi:MAG: cytochrome o ubiquinol oxidase subunit IV [Rhodobacteraceae bacterium]|nr:cytochrome o ubiquinol oxidase subunit IV [Paracoccaceae bacterium]
MIGFALSLALTGFAFWIMLGTTLSSGKTMTIIGVLAIVQLIVQMRFFLHIDRSKQKREDLDLILFSTLVLLIIVFGTVWIMGNLSTRMHMAI